MGRSAGDNEKTESTKVGAREDGARDENPRVVRANGDTGMGAKDDNPRGVSSGPSYHRAYLHAEIKPQSERSKAEGFNILITALVGGVWKLEEDPEDYTCEHLAEMRTVKEETLRGTHCRNPSIFYKR